MVASPCEACPTRATCRAPCDLLAELLPTEDASSWRERSLPDFWHDKGRAVGLRVEPDAQDPEDLPVGPPPAALVAARGLLKGRHRALVDACLTGASIETVSRVQGRSVPATRKALTRARQRLELASESLPPAHPRPRRPRPGPTRTDPAALFWAKVVRGDDGCWRWTGTLTRDGYGKFQVTRSRGSKRRGERSGQRTVFAHRYAWELAVGRPPKGLVAHTCGTPACVRLDHLVATEGLAQVHAASALAGRRPRGERVIGAKLRGDEVVALLAAHPRGSEVGAWALRLGISRAHVYAVLRGRVWSHLTGAGGRGC